ncbi:MAG: TIGR03067 domain-containing protein [Phycisphaerae bacterium]|nr:TIGR03067 domain-containing protein [Tepidisphaeraceae bacterium]
MRTLLCAALAITLLVSPARAADDVKAVKEKLQGTWVVTAANKKGREITGPGLAKLRVVFAGDVMTIKDTDKTKGDDATITAIDASKSPAWIDLTPAGDEGKAQGVYQLDGDTFEICFTAGPGIARPEKIGRGEKLLYLKMTRQK